MATAISQARSTSVWRRGGSTEHSARRNRGQRVQRVIAELRRYAIGWMNYFGISHTYKVVLELEGSDSMVVWRDAPLREAAASALRAFQGSSTPCPVPKHLLVHGEVFDTPALADKNCAPELRAAWGRLKTAVDSAADSITFQQLLDEGGEKEKMYYI